MTFEKRREAARQVMWSMYPMIPREDIDDVIEAFCAGDTLYVEDPNEKVMWGRVFQYAPLQPKGDTCGAWGGCVSPKGHNMGKADVPENHQPKGDT